MALVNYQAIAEESQRLAALSDTTTPNPHALTAKINGAQFTAMCLGAMLALSWVIGDEEPPSESIPKRVKDLK